MSRVRSAVVLFLALASAVAGACGTEPTCVDGDADGYGVGCVLGEDCDDENAGRTNDCDRLPPPDCSLDPFATGCPCLAGAVSRCYAGPVETEGVGLCQAGRTICINGHWGLCDGAVLPRGETCDGIDQDCDGVADDGVLSPCGGCAPGCRGGVWGEAESPFSSSDALSVLAGGELTLAYGPRSTSGSVWVANSGEATVSKIDAATAMEVARYATGGAEPSRVAVDYRGDAWVANREFEGVSTVTKIAGSREHCVDAAGDGLTTSTGPEDVLPFGEDECVLFRTAIGAPGEVARALAIDGERGLDDASGGNAWVGLQEGQAVVVLDGITGAVVSRIEVPGFSPYAAAFDAWGTLWLSSRDGFLARIDRGAASPQAEVIEVPLACYLLYGLAVDDEGRVFATGFSCDDVVTYDPRRDFFRALQTPPSPRGISVARDGSLFVAHTEGSVSRLSADGAQVLGSYGLASPDAEPFESVGVGVDAFGQVWVASSQGGGPRGEGIATRLDAMDGTVIAQVPIGIAPHTQGDLSGAELRGGFVEEGATTHVFDGCVDGETEWLNLHLDAARGSSGTVELSMRHAPTRESLGAATFSILGTFPGDAAPYALNSLGGVRGGVLEVRLVLRTRDRDGAPRVRRVGAEWRCPGPD